MELNVITGTIVDAAFRVHRALGPGLMETAYRACLVHELRKRGLTVETEVRLPIAYDGIRLDVGYRIDLLVEDTVIVELKAVTRVLPIHEAQLLSYLRLCDRRVGLLINFHVVRFRDGVRRMVNNAPE
jgi:GxxExxY protein